MVQAAARDAVALVESKVAEDMPQAGEGGRRSDSSWMADTEEGIVAVHKEAAVHSETGEVVPLADIGRIQSAVGEDSFRSMPVVVVAAGKRPEDKPGWTAAAAVVHQEDRPVVAAGRTL